MLKELRKLALNISIDDEGATGAVIGPIIWEGWAPPSTDTSPLTTQGYLNLFDDNPEAFLDTLYKYDPWRSPTEDRFGEIMNITPGYEYIRPEQEITTPSGETYVIPADTISAPADTTMTHGIIKGGPRAYNWVGGGESAWGDNLFEAMSTIFDRGRMRPFSGMYDTNRRFHGEPEVLPAFPFGDLFDPYGKER